MRHDLLTPVNHVIGYAELARDDAADLGREGVATSLQSIAEAGTELAEAIRGELSSDDGLEGSALGSRLGPPFARSVREVERLRGDPGLGETAADLERIETALRDLRRRLREELGLSLDESGSESDR